MTAPENSSATAPIGGLGVIETAGIEIIAESERTAKPRDLIWPWFAANVSVFGMSYGSYLIGFGISFVQATIVAVIGIVISFLLCGLVAIAGKRGSVPTMVLSRAAFGVHGQKVPGVVSWLTSIGWETVLAISAVLATATVLDVLGIASGTAVTAIAETCGRPPQSRSVPVLGLGASASPEDSQRLWILRLDEKTDTLTLESRPMDAQAAEPVLTLSTAGWFR